MVKIRLKRMGRHKNPTFRLIAVDSKAKSNGSYIELIGDYNPLRNTYSVDQYIAIKWLANGAQPTDTARNLLKHAKVLALFAELKANNKLAEYLSNNTSSERCNGSFEEKQKPTKPKQEPVVQVQPEPIVEPEPVIEEPEPIVEPEPVIEEPEPVIEEPEVQPEPEPVVEETVVAEELVAEPELVIEEPIVEETVEAQEPEPVVEETVLAEDADEEDEDDMEDDDDDGIDFTEEDEVEEAPEVQVIDAPADLQITKAFPNVVAISGISSLPIRKLDDSTIMLTAKSKRASDIIIELPKLTDYAVNHTQPTKIEFKLKDAPDGYKIRAAKLEGKGVKVTSDLVFNILTTLSLDDQKISFILKLIINKPEENKTDLDLANSSLLETDLSEEEINLREKEALRVIPSREVSKLEVKPNTVMVSMHPKNVEEIVNNQKTALFFKKLPAIDVQRVVIYCIKPIGKVVGEFILKGTNKLSRTAGWKEYGANSTLTRTEFNEYFEGKKACRVMELKSFLKYKTPKLLGAYKIKRGPSGFRYLIKDSK